MSTNNALFIDSETSVLESIKRMLMDVNQSAFFASNAEEALNIISNNEINTMFVDITSGNLIDLLEKVQELKPQIVKVVISDFSHLTLVINSIRKLNLHSFLLKPWKKNELLETLKSADDYATFLKLQLQEKENLEQKNVIYQRIINFKDDVGETNKIDINALKNTLFYSASRYENLIKNLEHSNIELALRSIYTASEIFTSAFPSFVEKFNVSELLNSFALTNLNTQDETGDVTFIKNQTLIREFIVRVFKFLETFFNGENITLNISKDQDEMHINLYGKYNSNEKASLVMFFEYLKEAYSTLKIELAHEIYDDGNFKVKLVI